MKIKTPEEIASMTEDLHGLANIRAINRLFREQDESHLWPINGRFNATERAIRRVREFQRHNGAVYGYEYAMMIDHALSIIVNEDF